MKNPNDSLNKHESQPVMPSAPTVEAGVAGEESQSLGAASGSVSGAQTAQYSERLFLLLESLATQLRHARYRNPEAFNAFVNSACEPVVFAHTYSAAINLCMKIRGER